VIDLPTKRMPLDAKHQDLVRILGEEVVGVSTVIKYP
jgi:hypothetical protein